MPHGERHRSERIGWLRAAMVGASYTETAPAAPVQFAREST